MKFSKYVKSHLIVPVRQQYCVQQQKPRHLICFKQWTAQMVSDIIKSAINLKLSCADTRLQRLNTLANTKVMILQEVNEPILNMAVSKAATLLGAYDVNITDSVIWEKDYCGKVFSMMADVIFVSTTIHMCVMRFAEQSTAPVLCMRSRTHASIQALSTVMAIMEEYGTMRGVNVAYVGSPHPVLNSYLLLCPMLGANIRFKCCCKEVGFSPLLLKSSEDMTADTNTETKECRTIDEVLENACAIISGPTSNKKHAKHDYKINVKEIQKNTPCQWIYFHTCPRGCECDDELFNHYNARTFKSYQNMHYVAAALMANAVKGVKF